MSLPPSRPRALSRAAPEPVEGPASDLRPEPVEGQPPDPSATPPVDPHPRRALLWPVLGVIAMITYNTWVLWIPVNGHPHILDGYLSELSASDQPNDLFFRGGDLITALIVGALGIRAVLVWRHRARRAWWLVSAWALIAFAVATFFDAFFAMDCSPTLSDACRIAEETGQLSTIHYAHTYTSVIAQTGVVTSILAAYIALAPQRSVGDPPSLVAARRLRRRGGRAGDHAGDDRRGPAVAGDPTGRHRAGRVDLVRGGGVRRPRAAAGGQDGRHR